MDIPNMIKDMFLQMFDITIEPFNKETVFDKTTEKKELEKRRLIIEEQEYKYYL